MSMKNTNENSGNLTRESVDHANNETDPCQIAKKNADCCQYDSIGSSRMRTGFVLFR
jgi:hypothetical protein